MTNYNHLIRSIAVYCGASNTISQKYKDLAEELGTALARAGITLVFGGGCVGLMGIVSSACHQAGGRVIGIMPDFLYSREGAHTGITELHIVKSMHERKQMMFERADGFIALPGGFGTLDETFEILTWYQIGLHNKPLVWLNAFNYWTNLLQPQIEYMVNEGFVREADRHIYNITHTVKDTVDYFQNVVTDDKDRVGERG